MIPNIDDNVVLIKDDYYSGMKKGSKGIVTCVSLWYWRADVLFEDGLRTNIHFDCLGKVDKKQEEK